MDENITDSKFCERMQIGLGWAGWWIAMVVMVTYASGKAKPGPVPSGFVISLAVYGMMCGIISCVVGIEAAVVFCIYAKAIEVVGDSLDYLTDPEPKALSRNGVIVRVFCITALLYLCEVGVCYLRAGGASVNPLALLAAPFVGVWAVGEWVAY